MFRQLLKYPFPVVTQPVSSVLLLHPAPPATREDDAEMSARDRSRGSGKQR